MCLDRQGEELVRATSFILDRNVCLTQFVWSRVGRGITLIKLKEREKSKSGHSCPRQNCSRGPPAEKTGRWSLQDCPSWTLTSQSVNGRTELNWMNRGKNFTQTGLGSWQEHTVPHSDSLLARCAGTRDTVVFHWENLDSLTGLSHYACFGFGCYSILMTASCDVLPVYCTPACWFWMWYHF